MLADSFEHFNTTTYFNGTNSQLSACVWESSVLNQAVFRWSLVLVPSEPSGVKHEKQTKRGYTANVSISIGISNNLNIQTAASRATSATPEPTDGRCDWQVCGGAFPNYNL